MKTINTETQTTLTKEELVNKRVETIMLKDIYYRLLVEDKDAFDQALNNWRGRGDYIEAVETVHDSGDLWITVRFDSIDYLVWFAGTLKVNEHLNRELSDYK